MTFEEKAQAEACLDQEKPADSLAKASLKEHIALIGSAKMGVLSCKARRFLSFKV